MLNIIVDNLSISFYYYFFITYKSHFIYPTPNDLPINLLYSIYTFVVYIVCFSNFFF